MKKIILFLGLIVLLGSCSITNDITFREDGSISYRSETDLSMLMSIMGEKNGILDKIDTDTIISFADIFREELQKGGNELSKEQEELISNLKPLSIRIPFNGEKNDFRIFFFGDFKDDNELNRVFSSINKLEASMDQKEIFNGSASLSERYKWDGSRMEMIFDPTHVDKEESEPELDMLLSNSNIKVSYHFPRKVKSVNNPDALLSQDGSTVIFNYSLSEMKQNVKNIVVELEK